MTKLDKIAIILPKGIPFRYIKGQFNVYSLSTVPLTIPALVSLIPKELNIKVEIYDESIEIINKESINADLIVISAITPTVNRAYKYADYFRSKKIPVVMGGVHATLNPQEALQHANSVICGIAMENFPQMLRDFKENKLQRIYTQQENIDLSQMPLPDMDCYKSKSKFPIKLNGIQATFGCDNNCEFCVQPLVCSGYHQRPVEQVIEEIKTIKSKFIEFYDPNIARDKEYLRRLCEGMIPLKKNWVAPATIDLADNEDLLKLAAKSGCRSVLIGFESVNQNTLNEIFKGFNNVYKYQDAIKRFHKAGIAVAGSFVFGFDSDTKDVFKQTLDFINKTHIDMPRFTLNTPFPGTPFYEKMKQENRIIEYNWSMYDCNHVVIKPKNMSVKELQEGFDWINKEAYKLGSILKRVEFVNLSSLLVLTANIGLKTKCGGSVKYTRNIMTDNSDI
ncbi:MAG TPA: radical SAM protein [Candidatus Gastranaerophilales bacterium]|nr:radical SAM protein [Candidatus Gastranaerophilales bacterium]